jgi:hypothetical protein
MSGRIDKKLRQVAKKKQLVLLAEAIKEIQAWPFGRRLSFAWSICFPSKSKKLKVSRQQPSASI